MFIRMATDLTFSWDDSRSLQIDPVADQDDAVRACVAEPAQVPDDLLRCVEAHLIGGS